MRTAVLERQSRAPRPVRAGTHAGSDGSAPDRVLVAAADPPEARKIRSILAAESWELRVASAGEEALKAAESAGLILLGFPLAGPYGRLIVEAVKGRAASRRPALLAIVEEGPGEARRQALAAGADQALTRPVDPVDLLSRVRTLMELRRLRRAVEEAGELKRAAEKEMESLRSRQIAFAGKLSHDLKNPLTGIMGHAQMLQMKLEGANGGLEATAGKILGAARQVQELLADTRDLGSLEQGRLRLGAERIDLHSILSMVIGERLGDDRAGDIDLELIPSRPDPGHPILVEVDPGLMLRVLHNLVANAIRHAAPGGRVRVHLGRPGESKAEIHVSDIADEPPEAPEVSLPPGTAGADTPGESREDSRLHSGLRMDFCRAAVEALGGRLWARPNASGGSTFGLVLPTVADAGA